MKRKEENGEEEKFFRLKGLGMKVGLEYLGKFMGGYMFF